MGEGRCRDLEKGIEWVVELLVHGCGAVGDRDVFLN